MRLHHLNRAAECMEKAFELVKDKNYLESYISALALLGAQEKILEVTRRENVPSEMTDAILARCRKSEASYASTERGMKMQAGLDLKKQQDFEAYSQFVEKYLEEQKKKYELP